jgi:erythromycin esterase
MKTVITLLLSLSISITHLFSQSLTADQLSFLQNNVSTISLSESAAVAEWNDILPHIKDKRIILLGEPNHGAKQVFEHRNSLIEFLHDKLGYKTILFESGIGELAFSDLNKKEISASQMSNGFFGGWRTNEFRNLMVYVRQNDLSIAGFDVQRTGGSFKELFRQTLQSKKLDTTLSNIEDRYPQVQRELTNSKVVYDSVVAKTNELISVYRIVLQQLEERDPSKQVLLTGKTIENRIAFLQYMLQFTKERNWNKRWAARDSMMAENIEWLSENIYKNEKLIIIAHNFHISKYNENELTMGEVLNEKYGKEMYALSMFAGSGSYADNSGKETKMLAPDSASMDIKHIINSLPGFSSYLNIPKQQKGAEWLYQPITVNDTFIDLKNSNKMILSKPFDGLIFIKSITPPVK